MNSPALPWKYWRIIWMRVWLVCVGWGGWWCCCVCICVFVCLCLCVCACVCMRVCVCDLFHFTVTSKLPWNSLFESKSSFDDNQVCVHVYVWSSSIYMLCIRVIIKYVCIYMWSLSIYLCLYMCDHQVSVCVCVCWCVIINDVYMCDDQVCVCVIICMTIKYLYVWSSMMCMWWFVWCSSMYMCDHQVCVCDHQVIHCAPQVNSDSPGEVWFSVLHCHCFYWFSFVVYDVCDYSFIFVIYFVCDYSFYVTGCAMSVLCSKSPIYSYYVMCWVPI